MRLFLRFWEVFTESRCCYCRGNRYNAALQGLSAADYKKLASGDSHKTPPKGERGVANGSLVGGDCEYL